MIPTRQHAVALLAAVMLAVTPYACSSSGGGISGTGLVAGAISGFGSIIVADIEFDTSTAVVTIEGDPATIDDLELGMFVFVRGSFDRGSMTGVADRIATDHIVLGPVERVDGASFTAMAQTVLTDASTVFAGTSPGTLAPGDIVEVFGVTGAEGTIRATRVALVAETDEFELTGTVENLDANAQTFLLGNLTVDFSNAELEGFPPGGLANGQTVEAESDEAPVADVLNAAGVELRTSPFEEGDAAEIEGVVTSVISQVEFIVNATQRVFIVEETRFENGDRGDIAINARVDVEGSIAGDGSLVADEIEFQP